MSLQKLDIPISIAGTQTNRYCRLKTVAITSKSQDNYFSIEFKGQKN